MFEIGKILADLSNPDNITRSKAEGIINETQNADIGNFVVSLITYVRNEQNSVTSRQQAIILLKNSVALNVRDKKRKEELRNKWVCINANTRHHIKQEILTTLASPVHEVRYIAALCIANLARIELPYKEWPDLLNFLFNAANSQNEGNIEAALTTLGYISEESNNSSELLHVLKDYRNELLNVICKGLRNKESRNIQFFASNAMSNSMEFISEAMGQDAYRNFIIESIQISLFDTEERTMLKAMECISKLGSLYYDYLQPHIQQLTSLTLNAIKASPEPVAIQAILFWSFICHIETERLDNNENILGFSNAVCENLAIVLCEGLLKQEEYQTDEDWNLSIASAKALTNLAEVVGNNILTFVMPFIHTNFQSSNWKCIEASLSAFGCILGSPEEHVIIPIIKEAYPTCLNLMHHEHINVADTASWVVGQIATNHFSIVRENEAYFKQLMTTVTKLLVLNERMAHRGY